MDLGTMAQKVQAGEYTGVQQLRSDFKLVISNCRTYNRVGVSDEAGQFLDAAAKLELEGDALFDAALAPDGGSGQRRRAPPKVFVAGSASGRTKPRADTEQPSPAPRPPASSPRKKKQPSSSTAPKVESDVFEECPHCAPGSGKAKGHKGRHVSTVKATLPDGHKPRPTGRAPKGKRWDGTGWVSTETGEGQAKRPPAPQPGEDPSGRINLVSAPSPRPPASSPRKAKQPPQPQPSSTPTAPAKASPAKINSQPDQTVSRTAPCTACGGDVGSDQLTHPNLPGSLLCDECHERVSRPFKRDEEGIETCCRWCGYGGELMLCDECPSTFCKGCISRNIGAEELSELEKTKDDWACLRCNPSQVQSKKLVFSRPPAQPKLTDDSPPPVSARPGSASDTGASAAAPAAAQPPKALDAYKLFCAEQRAKGDLPRAVPEQSKVIGQRWRDVSPGHKARLEEQAKAQKAARQAWLATDTGKAWAEADKATKQENKRKKEEQELEKSAKMSAEASWIAARRKDKKVRLSLAPTHQRLTMPAEQ